MFDFDRLNHHLEIMYLRESYAKCMPSGEFFLQDPAGSWAAMPEKKSQRLGG